MMFCRTGWTLSEMSINYKILAVYRDDENMRAAVKLLER